MCAPSPEVSFRLHAIAWGVSEIKIDPKDGRSCEREEVKIFNMFFFTTNAPSPGQAGF